MPTEEEQANLLAQMMQADEADGLYDMPKIREKFATVTDGGIEYDIFRTPNGVGGHVYESYDGNGEGVTAFLIDDAMATPNALAAAMEDAGLSPVSKWVSVDERLPDLDTAVLIFTDDHTQYIGTCEDGYWWSDEGGRSGYELENVTHWMPLLPNP